MASRESGDGKPGKNGRRKSLREVGRAGNRSLRIIGDYPNGVKGESGEGGGVMVVITRPKGGRRPLCMDMEEVKACKDLGFELEHERLLEGPSRLSVSGSNGGGGSSPIPSWRISSPGDDPRDVKARLKVWAQAVAHASATQPL